MMDDYQSRRITVHSTAAEFVDTPGTWKGALFKRKDFLDVDEGAQTHPNRTYYFRRDQNIEEVILTCTKALQVGSNFNSLN
jgi:hypothetical protein